MEKMIAATANGDVGCTDDIAAEMTTAFTSANFTEAAASAFVQFACSQFNTASATKASLDGSFTLANTYLVFFMQAGFAMLCAGSVRSKNCMNILVKNVLDACFGAPVFFLFGYGFAYGAKDPVNSFIGNDLFALDDFTDWSGFIFQWAFAAATATIVSGSVAERCSFQAYICYSIFLTGFVYPVVVHWVWSEQGFLSAFETDPLWDSGMVDFAGSGVVHSVGGIAGMWGALIIGPRSGRFLADGSPSPDFQGHSMTLVVLGTFILWFGWYGFNPGSMLAISDAVSLEVVGRAAVTTTLSAASAGVMALMRARVKTGHWDLSAACNGLLAGLVGITAGCSVVEPAAAILCGALAALLFDAVCDLLLRLKIDDPLAAAPMHGACGMFGVLFVGLLAKQKYLDQVYGRTGSPEGLFYGGNGKLMACQVCGMLCILAWTSALIGSTFMILRMMGILRVPEEEEMVGLDQSHHGGSAYYISHPMNPLNETTAFEPMHGDLPAVNFGAVRTSKTSMDSRGPKGSMDNKVANIAELM